MGLSQAVEARIGGRVGCENLRVIFSGLKSRLVCHSSHDGTEFGGSVYQKVNSNLETAVTLAWTAGSNNTRFSVGAKYQLDKNSSVSVSADLISELNCKQGFLVSK